MDLDLCPCYWLSDSGDSDSLGTIEQGETQENPRCIVNGFKHEWESGFKEETVLYTITLA